MHVTQQLRRTLNRYYVCNTDHKVCTNMSTKVFCVKHVNSCIVAYNQPLLKEKNDRKSRLCNSLITPTASLRNMVHSMCSTKVQHSPANIYLKPSMNNVWCIMTRSQRRRQVIAFLHTTNTFISNGSCVALCVMLKWDLCVDGLTEMVAEGEC